MAVSISRDQFSDAPCGQITNLKIIASFNWEANDLSEEAPRILSPGFPPLLQENSAITELEKDSQDDMVDQTLLRSGEYPIEVLFRAVEVCDPGFAWRDVSVVANRNVLRKFLAFLNGATEAFRLYIDRVGRCFVMTQDYEAKLEQESHLGYGHTFEKVNSRMEHAPGCRPKEYYCITSYQLGDLKLVVKAEADAVHLKKGVQPEEDPPAVEGESMVPDKVPGAVQWDTREGSILEHSNIGKLISKEDYDIIEMKTVNRYQSQFPRWESIYYQMILGGVDHTLMAIHYKGTILSRTRYPIDEIRQNLQNPDANLGRLHLLLKMIMSTILEMETIDRHTVVQLHYLPETHQIALDRTDQTCSKIPKWVVPKLGK